MLKKVKKIYTKIKVLLELIKIHFAKKNNNSYLLWDCLVDANTECIDAYSLFKYLIKEKKNAYYVILENNKLYQKLKKENNLKNIIVIKNSIQTHPIEFLYKIKPILIQSKYILTSFTENYKLINTFLKKNKSFKYIFIQHGVTYLKESVFLKKYIKPNSFDKYLVSSDYEKDLFIKYGFKKDELILSGMPRWEYLENINKERKSIFIMFTWRNFSNNKLLESTYLKNILELLNDNKLKKLAQKHNLIISFILHHALEKILQDDYFFPNYINIIKQEEISLNIKKASLLITDFSSITFDFMFLNKPVILYGLDIEDNKLSPLDRFDLEKLKEKQKIFPNIFFDKNDVINKLENYINNDFEIEVYNQNLYTKFFSQKINICQDITMLIEQN